MNLEFIDNYIYEKQMKNEDIITFTFYELRVKYNFTEEETRNLLMLSKNKLENMNYKVYFTGNTYVVDEQEYMVQDNELLVAIKNK